MFTPIESLESRCLFAGISITPTTLPNTPMPPPVTVPLTTTPVTSATTAQPAFYTPAVMKYLVKRGFLTQQEATQSMNRRTVVDKLVQAKREAQLLGASDAALQKAIELVFKGRSTEARRTLVADGFDLPANRIALFEEN